MTKSKFHNNFSDLYGDVTISGSVSGIWQPGYLGNDSFIAICPGEFNLSGLDSTRFSQIIAIELGYTGRGAQLRRPATLPAGSPGENALCAIKIIPRGFKATGATVYGDTSSTWEVYSCSLSQNTTTALLASAVSVGSLATAFLSDVLGNGSNHVILKWLPNSTTDDLFGAKIHLVPAPDVIPI